MEMKRVGKEMIGITDVYYSTTDVNRINAIVFFLQFLSPPLDSIDIDTSSRYLQSAF